MNKVNELEVFKDTIDYAVEQFTKAFKRRQSTTQARQYIQRLPIACQVEANRLIKEYTSNNKQDMQSNQSYR
jgi:hypothetical protein